MKKTNGSGQLFPGEHEDIREELRDLLQTDPDPWLDEPNPRWKFRKPRDLIGTEEERHLRNWIRMVKHGMVT